MLRRNLFSFAKVSPVQIRSRVSEAQLAATPRYTAIFKHRLAQRFDRVTDENRFESLRLILGRLSGHVGRRQYPLAHDMSMLFLEKFKRIGLDWHEVLALPAPVLLHVLDKQVGMSPSQRRLFMSAVHCRTCGVLVEGSTRRPGIVCQNRGQPEHGFRCGKKGHTSRVYFEGKHPRSRVETSSNIAALTASVDSSRKFLAGDETNSNMNKGSGSGSAAAQSIPEVETEFTTEEDAKVHVRVSSKPDFRVVGRLFHESHPRSWSSPTSPSFDVTPIGYEFYLHPADARAFPQIVQGAHEWHIHAEALRNVVWELLELQAIERVRPANAAAAAFSQSPSSSPSSSSSVSPFQPFQLRRGDVRSERDVLDALKAYYTTVDPQTGVIIENCMTFDDGGAGGDDTAAAAAADGATELGHQRLRNVVPWFIPSDPRPLNADGVPAHFPLAPSVAVQCLYRRPDNASAAGDNQQSKLVTPPLLEYRCFFHNKACFTWPTPDIKSKAVSEILDVARRVPFALPFTLYFRVDSTRELSWNKGLLKKQRDELLDEKADFFDLTKFCEIEFKRMEQQQQQQEKDRSVIEVLPEPKSSKESAAAVDESVEMERLIQSLNPEGWE